jgi:hypothetical protein
MYNLGISLEKICQMHYAILQQAILQKFFHKKQVQPWQAFTDICTNIL